MCSVLLKALNVVGSPLSRHWLTLYLSFVKKLESFPAGQTFLRCWECRIIYVQNLVRNDSIVIMEKNAKKDLEPSKKFWNLLVVAAWLPIQSSLSNKPQTNRLVWLSRRSNLHAWLNFDAQNSGKSQKAFRLPFNTFFACIWQGRY